MLCPVAHPRPFGVSCPFMEVEKRNFDVVVLAGINTDFIIRSEQLPQPGQSVRGDSFYTGTGGKGCNQAVAAARLGARTAIIARVGSDDRGRAAIRDLKQNRVDVRHITHDSKAPTGAAIIAVDADGEKQISAALGANMRLAPRLVRAAGQLIASARVLLMQFETPMESVLAAAKLAREHKVQVALDPAPPSEVPEDLFPLLDLIRPNSDEAGAITGVKVKDRDSARKAARKLLTKGVRIVALESGDGGDLIVTPQEEFFFPRMKVTTVDATGAGDAFAGAFAAGLAEGLRLRDIGRLANATAALSTTRLGAQEALPTRREVEKFLKSRCGGPE